jgi:hypothetical protein
MSSLNPTEKTSPAEVDPRPVSHGQNLADDNDVLPDDDDLPSDRSQGTRSDLTLEESKRASAEAEANARPSGSTKRI